MRGVVEGKLTDCSRHDDEAGPVVLDESAHFGCFVQEPIAVR